MNTITQIELEQVICLNESQQLRTVNEELSVCVTCVYR